MSTHISSHSLSMPEHSERKNKFDAERYVTQSWIPVSETILNQIRFKAKQDLYRDTPTSLLFDLRQDLGLFSWFLRNLPELLHTSSCAAVPTKIIEFVDWDRCNDLLISTDIRNFPHKLEGSLKVQSSSIKYAVISSTTAEAVAACSEVDPELAHLCATVRQIGINLVAWNYPKLFSRAIGTYNEESGSLEKHLYKFLGYSPTTLAAKLCLDWDDKLQVKTLVSSAFGQKDYSELEPEQIKQEEKLKERMDNCLELGDAMACLADPEHYPKHAKNWQTTKDKLQKSLGPNAIDEVQSRLSGFSETYSTSEFSFNIDLEPKKNLTQTSIFRVADRLMAGNPWVPKCSEFLQKKFRKIYSTIDKRGISTDAISILISELIPELGFVRGCIYRHDLRAASLRPILRIGETQINKFEVLKTNLARQMKHPAVVATCYTTPIVQEDNFVNGNLVSTIASVFGTNSKQAVLYVEISTKVDLNSDKTSALIHFKAIQKTLVDCLNFD